MSERFKNEYPIKITVAAHVNGHIEIKPEERSNKTILLQLRDGDDKGAAFGIKAVELLIRKVKGIKILSFRNYKGEVPPFIEYRGFVSRDEYIYLFNVSSIFILPPLVEGFLTPVLEAMSCGCVPIATRCGGPEEMIKNSINRLLVPIRDPLAIYNAVTSLLNSPEIRIKMAYESIKETKKYNYERTYNEFIKGIKKYEKTKKEKKLVLLMFNRNVKLLNNIVDEIVIVDRSDPPI